MNEIKVFTSNDDLVIDRICEIFKERDIPFIKKEEGAGNYIKIVYGKSTISNKKIYVSEEDYEKAKELVDFLNAEEFEEETEENDETSNELKAIKVDEFGYKKYSWPAKILGGMALANCIFLIVLLAIAIVSTIKNR